jgi:hypothetical protein
MAVNPHLAQFHEDLSARYPVDGAGMSMTEWCMANTHLRGKRFSLDQYEFQRGVLDDMAEDLTVIKPSQVGMALDVNTPVATPDGWSTMGELQEGDVIFDEKGAPTNVTYVSPVFTDHPCYRITFDTGEQIVADENHRWYVEALSPFKGEVVHRLPGRAPRDFSKEGVLRTAFLAKTFQRGNRNVYAIPTTQPLDLPERALSVDPYLLGLWLGDGNTHAAVLTAHVNDVGFYATELGRRGVEPRLSSVKDDTIQLGFNLPRDRAICPRGHDKGVEGTTSQNSCKRCARQNRGREDREPSTSYDTLSRRLKRLGLLAQVKFIPEEYLRASRSQRLDLLAGLMDTDGTISKQGRASFYNTNPRLVRGAVDLIHSMGWKARVRWRKPTSKPGDRVQSKLDCAEVSFVAYAEEAPFLLPRKRERLGAKAQGRPTEALRRRIVNIEAVPPIPVRCISVDSPNHLFLAGEGMIPTHNTEVQVRKFLAFLARNRGATGILTFPNEVMFKKNSKTRIRPLVTSEKAFNAGGFDESPTRAMDLYEINGSWAHINGMTEGAATSTPADILFHDELDLSDPALISLYGSRLQNSDFGITQKFSTPTLPGYGIDSSYAASDQREYMIRCSAPSCGHWQVPRFTTSFIRIPGWDGADLMALEADTLNEEQRKGAHLVCERCHKPLNLGDPSIREWVAAYPARGPHGYRIRPFSTIRISPAYVIKQLLKSKVDDTPKVFHNTVIGEPYADGNSKLEPDVVRKAMFGASTPDVGSTVPVALGCDMGKTCHLTLGVIEGERAHPFLFEQVPSEQIEDRIKELRRQYNVVCGGVDRLPYTPTAMAISEASRHEIMAVQYSGPSQVRIVEDEYGNVAYAQINRTSAIDTFIRSINGIDPIRLTGYGSLGPVVIEHLCDQVRVEVDDKPAVWEKLTGKDHFLHSLVLMRAGIKIRQVIIMTRTDVKRTLMGMVSVPSHRTPTLGDPHMKQRRIA